jgi:hypothetical protein
VGARVQPGDWVTYDGIDWLITKWGFDEQFQFTLELSETGSDIYDEEGIDAGPVVVPGSSPANPSLISTVANFNVAAGLITGTNGAQIPALEFTWDDPQDPTITAVRIEYRKAGTSAPVLTATATDVPSGALIVSEGVQSSTQYEARATVTIRPDRLKTFTSWVTTAEATVPLQVILGEVAQDVAGTLESMRADHNSLRALVTDLADTVSGAGLSNRLTLGRVQTRVGTAEATVKSEIITRASETGALAADITNLEASLTDVETDISANASAISATQASVSALDGDVTALASDVTAVEAVAGQASAGGLIKWEATAAPSGVLARFSIYGKATSGGTYRDGGASLDITATEAFWNFFSDQFRILKPDGTPIAVFGSDAGDLVLQNIRVGTVTFDQLSSANGKLVLKGSGDDASIEVFS